MASTRKTRKVHKKFAKVNDEWPEKEGPSTSNKSKNKVNLILHKFSI
jgi:hypothetical protein